jgi:putative MATE family efflux protein
MPSSYTIQTCNEGESSVEDLKEATRTDPAAQMGETSVLRLLSKFSLPAMIGMIVQAVYYTTDRIFLGQALGPLGIAGITITFPITMIGFAVAMLISVGATSLISIRLGERKKEEAEKILGMALVLLISGGLILTVLGLLFLDPLLLLVGASPGILPYAREFMQISLWGLVFTFIVFGMGNFIRGEGNPKAAMIYMVIGSVMNIILDYVLIFECRMGMAGAAFANIIAQGLSSVLILHYFFSGAGLLKIHKGHFRVRFTITQKIFAISINSGPSRMKRNRTNPLRIISLK